MSNIEEITPNNQQYGGSESQIWRGEQEDLLGLTEATQPGIPTEVPKREKEPSPEPVPIPEPSCPEPDKTPHKEPAQPEREPEKIPEEV